MKMEIILVLKFKKKPFKNFKLSKKKVKVRDPQTESGIAVTGKVTLKQAVDPWSKLVSICSILAFEQLLFMLHFINSH